MKNSLGICIAFLTQPIIKLLGNSVPLIVQVVDVSRPRVRYTHDRPKRFVLSFSFMVRRLGCRCDTSEVSSRTNGKARRSILPSLIFLLLVTQRHQHTLRDKRMCNCSTYYSSKMASISSNPSGGGLVRLVFILGISKGDYSLSPGVLDPDKRFVMAFDEVSLGS